MIAVARGAALGASNPLLSEFIVDAGLLVAPVSLSWSIYDVSTGAKEDDPVLVAGPTAVNLTTHKVTTGRYAVAWTVPADEALGRHEIVWTVVVTTGGPTITWRRAFDVVAHQGLALGGYALISDLRAEGITADRASNRRLAQVIAESSAYIERVTGAFFEPRRKPLALDGTGKPMLDLDEPIVGIETIHVGPNLMASTDFKVYSAASSPSDRFAPRIARINGIYPGLIPANMPFDYPWPFSVAWPAARQAVALVGVFGFLDPDGSPAGGTPVQIARACKLLTIRNLAPLGDADAQFEARTKHRLTSERTREQSYTLGDGKGVGNMSGAFTGDPEIDDILELYSRPPYVGFAAA